MDKILIEAKTSSGDWEKIVVCESLEEWESIKPDMMELISGEYRASKVCSFCGRSYEIEERICGCSSSAAEDYAAWAESYRETYLEDR